MKKQKQTKKITDAEIRKLVIERLRTFPTGKRLSVGQQGTFTKEELVAHVEEEDSVGKKIIEIQLEYLRALGKGKIFDD
jgi:hypothetical protein